MKFLNVAVDVFPYPSSVVLFSDDLFQVKRVDGVCSLTVPYLFKMGLFHTVHLFSIAFELQVVDLIYEGRR